VKREVSPARPSGQFKAIATGNGASLASLGMNSNFRVRQSSAFFVNDAGLFPTPFGYEALNQMAQ
jgi:hypothetical protein